MQIVYQKEIEITYACPSRVWKLIDIVYSKTIKTIKRKRNTASINDGGEGDVFG